MNIKHYYIAVLLTAITSCDELIEPSLTDSTVQIISPADSIVSTDYNQTFYWEKTDGASSYQLQIVSPSFANSIRFVTDTLVKGNLYTISLSPGDYQWRIRAVNGSSNSVYITRSFSIDTASLQYQTIRLVAPATGTITNINIIQLSWQALFSANRYRLQIDNNNFSNSPFIADLQVPGIGYSFSIPTDGSYQWRVRAENDTAISQYSTINTFSLDHIPPSPPTLSSPVNNASATLPVTLQWNTPTDAVRYRLFIYKSDSTTLYNSTFPLQVNSTSYTFNIGSGQEKIYWQVKATDAAGNESDYSEKRSITLQ
jgi:uncharacterized protein YegP (UPF0339 family)